MTNWSKNWNKFMDEGELELAKDEFRTTRDTLTDLSIQRMFELENRENRIIERKHTSIIAFSSLAIALTAIVFPIYTNNKVADSVSIVSVILLLVSALYGIGLIIFSNVKEGLNNKLQNNTEQSFLNKQLEKVVGIYSKAIDGTLERNHIESYLQAKEESKKIYAQQVKPITEYYSMLDKLYNLFLVLFGLGFLLFFWSIFTTLTLI